MTWYFACLKHYLQVLSNYFIIVFCFREEKEKSPRRISGRKSIRFLTKPVVSVELNIFSWEKNWEKIWEKIFLTTDE